MAPPSPGRGGVAILGARRGERGGGSSPPAGEGRRRHREPLVSAGPRQRVRRAGPEVSGRGRRSSAFWSARGEEEKRVPGCGAWRGAGREEDGARRSSGAPGARGGVRSARAGRRAAGQSRGSRGPALRRAGRTRGRPLTPRAGGEGQHLGLGRASPRGGSGEPRMGRLHGKAVLFCLLGSQATEKRSLSPPWNLCSCVTCWGLHVGASRMKAHLDRSWSPVFPKLYLSGALVRDCASAAFDNGWKKEGRIDWAERGKKVRDWAGQV